MAKNTGETELEKLQKAASGKRKAEEKLEAAEKGKGAIARRFDQYLEDAHKRESISRRVTVDLGGGMSAQAVTEGLNWFVRKAAGWSGEGTWFNNWQDIWQGAPQFVIGNAVYVTELILRHGKQKDDDKYLPSGWREGVNEFGKIMGHLGFNNLMNAIRVRWGDSAGQAAQQAADAEAAKQEAASLRQQLQQMQQPRKPGGGGGGGNGGGGNAGGGGQ